MLDNDTFAAAWDSTVQFINASTGQVTATIEQAHEGPIRYMQFAGSKMRAGGSLLCPQSICCCWRSPISQGIHVIHFAGDESVHVLLTAAQKQVRLWKAPAP